MRAYMNTDNPENQQYNTHEYMSEKGHTQAPYLDMISVLQQQQSREVERARQHARRSVGRTPLALARRIHTRRVIIVWSLVAALDRVLTATGTGTGTDPTCFFNSAAAAIKRVRAVHVCARHGVLRGQVWRQRLCGPRLVGCRNLNGRETKSRLSTLDLQFSCKQDDTNRWNSSIIQNGKCFKYSRLLVAVIPLSI